MTTSPAAPNGKVNLLLLASGLWIGGAETVIQHLATNVDRRRFNVCVGHLEARGQIGAELERAGVDIVGLARDPNSAVRKPDYFSFLKVRRLIRERRIQVVHTHTTQGLVDVSLCKALSTDVKLVHTFHFGNYPHTRRSVVQMERVFSRFADRLFAVGEVQRQQLRSVFGFNDQRISFVYNGVREPGSASDPDVRRRVRDDHPLVIGTIATLIEQKGLADLLFVAKRLKDCGHHFRFVVVGEGMLRPALEAMRHDLGLEDTVAFTGWITNAAETALPAFDIFFQPSKWEAMSVAVLEAMAAGKPVVATPVGENPRVIQDGITGLLVPRGDIDQMSTALLRLASAPGLRRQMGEAGRRQWEQHFTVAHMARTYEQIYLDTLR